MWKVRPLEIEALWLSNFRPGYLGLTHYLPAFSTSRLAKLVNGSACLASNYSTFNLWPVNQNKFMACAGVKMLYSVRSNHHIPVYLVDSGIFLITKNPHRLYICYFSIPPLFFYLYYIESLVLIVAISLKLIN